MASRLIRTMRRCGVLRKSPDECVLALIASDEAREVIAEALEKLCGFGLGTHECNCYESADDAIAALVAWLSEDTDG